MKVLGLNFGRKNGNCIKFLNEAIKAAATSGAETEIIHMMGKKIAHCVGCGSCSRALEKGDDIRCAIKDDYEAISDAVLDADAIIVCAPVYVLAPTGQLKNFIDRFGPAHDKAYMCFENELRREKGAKLLPDNCFKKHYVSYISVGGATTDNWVSLGITGLLLFGMSLNMINVDMVSVRGAYRPDYQAEYLPRCKQLGTHTVEAFGKNAAEAWSGDAGVCPVCHNDVMTLGGTTDVSCPICGIHGKAAIEGGRLSVTFSPEEQRRSRLRFSGVLEHQVELGRKQRYEHFDQYMEKFVSMQDDM